MNPEYTAALFHLHSLLKQFNQLLGEGLEQGLLISPEAFVDFYLDLSQYSIDNANQVRLKTLPSTRAGLQARITALEKALDPKLDTNLANLIGFIFGG